MKLLLAAAMLFAAGNANAAPKENPLSKQIEQIKRFFKPRTPAAPAKAEWPLNIAPADAKVYLETEKPALIDVRTPDEYKAGHIAGALLIDYRGPNFREEMNKLDKNAKYLIYCRTGVRSGKSLDIMKELGFRDIHDIAGGITAWTAAGLPTVK